MKKLSIIYLSLTLNILLLNTAFGQKTYNNQKDLIDPAVNPGNILDEMRLPPARTLGTYFYNEAWKAGTVYMINDVVIKGHEIRFDVQKNHLEIRDKHQVRVCAFYKIDRFNILNSLSDTLEFISANKFNFEDGIPIIGFFEVLAKGDVLLYSRSKIKVIESNYVPTVDMGRRDNKIVIREDYFAMKDGIIYEIENSKNKNKYLFDQHFETVKRYAKDNHLKFSKREDLVKIFVFYNGLI